MPLAPGTRLGPYEILSPLGAGGMGEVYKARDARLGRDVAVKTLPLAFAQDVERLARFEREAKLLASLNHVNVAGIHGLEEVDGHRYLILEYVEGESLSDRLARGPLPVDEALEICRQIAAGVEAAHESGVVHRDLKPANVMLTTTGVAKVLDFGLARSGPTTGLGSDSQLTASPTMTAAMTGAGIILGTAAYMSPEQARGRPVDRRTDIWSFGCVMYECLTGRRVFEGETVSDLIARILEREPDWSALPARVPGRAIELLKRCLDKDSRKRLRDVGDARLQLEEALAEIQSTSRMAVAAAESRKQTRSASPLTRILMLTLGVVAGAVAGVAAWNTLGPGATLIARSRSFASATHLSVKLPDEVRFNSSSLSRDGSALICRGRLRKPEGSEEEPAPMIYIRKLDSYSIKPLPGTEGAQFLLQSRADDSLFFVAPVSPGSPRLRLSRIPLDGSAPPIGLTDWKPDWEEMTALNDGDLLILMNQGTTFLRIPADGGEPGPPMKVDAGDYRGSLRTAGGALPGDAGVLLNGVSYGSRGWYYRIALLDPKTGKVRFLLDDAGNAKYAPTGHLLFFTRGDALLAAPFDLAHLAITGPPAPLLSGLWTRFTAEPAGFSLAGNGTLMYRPGGTFYTERRLATVDAGGNVKPWGDERRGYTTAPSIARDGRRFAISITNAQGIDEIWVSDVDRPALRKIVAIPDADCDVGPMTPDGEAFVYARLGRDEKDGIYLQRTDGQGEPRLVVKPASPNDGVFVLPGRWTPDGSAFLYMEVVDGRSHLRIQRGLLTSTQPVEAKPAIQGFLDEFTGTFSPDGRMIAFASQDSGKSEIYVCSYHPDGTTSHPLRVSNGGGFAPDWAADGKSLFYNASAGRLMTVSIAETPVITAGAPVKVLDLEKLRIADFSVLPDGRLFGILTSELERADITDENLVLSFFDQVERAGQRGK